MPTVQKGNKLNTWGPQISYLTLPLNSWAELSAEGHVFSAGPVPLSGYSSVGFASQWHAVSLNVHLVISVYTRDA